MKTQEKTKEDQIKSALSHKLDEILADCSLVYELESYGDTTASRCVGYSEKDYENSKEQVKDEVETNFEGFCHDYDLEASKEEILEVLKEI